MRLPAQAGNGAKEGGVNPHAKLGKTFEFERNSASGYAANDWSESPAQRRH